MVKKTVEVPGIKPPQSVREVNGGWIIVIATVVVIGLSIVATKPAWLCGNYEIGQNITSWQVADSSTLAAQILWQKTEIPGLHDQGIPNSTLAVSNDHILVGRDSNYAICDFARDVVAFDRITAEKDWSFPASAIKWIEPIESDYLILYDDTFLAQLNTDGRQVWFPPKLPSRSARLLFVANSEVYLPAGSHTYTMREGEHSLSVIENQQILDGFNDILVRIEDNSHATIENSQTDQELWSLPIGDSLDSVFFPMSFPLHVEFFNNTTLFFYGINETQRIEAYKTEDGGLLWSLEKHFDSIPILLGNTIVAYSFDEGLHLYDTLDGSLVGQVTLTRANDDNTEWSSLPVWLAGSENTIAIMYRGSGEVVTLQLEL